MDTVRPEGVGLDNTGARVEDPKQRGHSLGRKCRWVVQDLELTVEHFEHFV